VQQSRSTPDRATPAARDRESGSNLAENLPSNMDLACLLDRNAVASIVQFLNR